MENKVHSILQRLNNVADIYYYIKANDLFKLKSDFSTNLSFKNKHYEDILSDNAFLNIGVIGNFSSGKSLFINSILGIELLGVDVLPATSKITKIKKGKESGRKYFLIKEDPNNKKNEISTEIDAEKYEKYSFRKEGEINQNSSFVKGIRRFEIHIDNPILDYINIYDTPGFSSDSEQDDELTKESIKEFDVVFWLIDCNKGSVGEDELKVLNAMQAGNAKVDIFAVVNKMDTKPPSERDKITKEVAKQYTFTQVMPYSALELLKYPKRLLDISNTKNEIINFIFENINNNKISLWFNNNNLTFELTNEEKREFTIPTLNSKYAEYKSYYDTLYSEVMLLRKNSISNQLNRLYLDLCEIEKNEINVIKGLIEKIEKKRDYLIGEIEYKKEFHRKEKEKIENAVQNRYKDIRAVMFEKVFNCLYQHGGNNNYKLVEEFPRNALEGIVSSRIKKIAELYIIFLEEFLQGIKDNDDDTPDYSGFLDEFVYTFTDASVNGLDAVHWLLYSGYSNFYHSKEIKRNIKLCIDDVIADEQIYSMGYLVAGREMDNVYEYYNRKYSEEIKKCSNALLYFKKALRILEQN